MSFSSFSDLAVRPIDVALYTPPIVWKGDVLGHVGYADCFFWVLKGECYLNIDNCSYIVKPNQLAFLPAGKLRSYTQVSNDFSMYFMTFECKSNGENVMSFLGFDKSDFVCEVDNPDEVTYLFESSNVKEFVKNPIEQLNWSANLIKLITIYAKSFNKARIDNKSFFKPALNFMSRNLDKVITVADIAKTVYTEPVYFIKKFKKAFSIPPLQYLNRLRVYNAMSLLINTRLSVDEIAKKVGVGDPSYFSRLFRKVCNISPSEYRNAFLSVEQKL